MSSNRFDHDPADQGVTRRAFLGLAGGAALLGGTATFLHPRVAVAAGSDAGGSKRASPSSRPSWGQASSPAVS
jgi:hypothetical protein